MFQYSVFTRFCIKQMGDDKCSKILFSKNKNFLSGIVVSFLRQSPYLCIDTAGWLYRYVSVALCIDIVSIRTVSSQPYPMACCIITAKSRPKRQILAQYLFYVWFYQYDKVWHARNNVSSYLGSGVYTRIFKRLKK